MKSMSIFSRNELLTISQVVDIKAMTGRISNGKQEWRVYYTNRA